MWDYGYPYSHHKYNKRCFRCRACGYHTEEEKKAVQDAAKAQLEHSGRTSVLRISYPTPAQDHPVNRIRHILLPAHVPVRYVAWWHGERCTEDAWPASQWSVDGLFPLKFEAVPYGAIIRFVLDGPPIGYNKRFHLLDDAWVFDRATLEAEWRAALLWCLQDATRLSAGPASVVMGYLTLDDGYKHSRA